MTARITVRVTPRSASERVEAGTGGVPLVRVAAAPADGKANASVCRIVAEALGVPKTSVRVVRGHASRVKTLEVDGASQQAVDRLTQGGSLS